MPLQGHSCKRLRRFDGPGSPTSTGPHRPKRHAWNIDQSTERNSLHEKKYVNIVDCCNVVRLRVLEFYTVYSQLKWLQDLNPFKYNSELDRNVQLLFIMAALCNRGPLYFCPVISFYLSIYLSFYIPRLISAAADWMSTILRHMVWP